MYGVGGSSERFPVIVELRKETSTPPRWIVKVDGGAAELRVTNKELMDNRLFNLRCLEDLNLSFRPMKPADWSDRIHEALQSLIEQPPAPDVSDDAQFHEALSEFLTNRRRGDTPEDLDRGVPWLDEENQRYCFRLRDFCGFLKRENSDPLREFGRHWVADQIRKLGGGECFPKIRGKSTRCWQVPFSEVDRAPELAPPPVRKAAF